jgi:hypothetical protein
VAQAPKPGWTVLGDLSNYPPQPDDISKGHEALMLHSATSGMAKGVLVVPKAVVAMQMKRIAGKARATKADVIGYASTVEEATKVLGG